MSDRRFEYFKGEQVHVHVTEPAHPITAGWPIGRSWIRSMRYPPWVAMRPCC